MLAWWLIACPRRGPESTVRLDALVDAADAAWEQRGEVGLEAAARPLLDAWMVAPDDPKIAWRMARWRLAEGLVATDPDAARASYAQAREVAVGCLEDDALFVQRRAGDGWEPALAELAAPRQPCAAWAALAWARWMTTLDPAATALDLDTVSALARTGAQSPRPQFKGVARWAEGISLAVRPTWAGRDLQAAAVAFGEAIEAAPDSVARRVDLYLHVVSVNDPAEAEALRSAILAMPARVPEDEAARARLEP